MKVQSFAMHLVDTTLFYSPTSGGVKRYLDAKHAWLAANTPWQHSLLVPGGETRILRGGLSTVYGLLLPGTFNYRLPLSPGEWTHSLRALDPDLLEVGDAFHPAWCALRVATERRIPLIAFFHSNLPTLIGRRLGTTSARAVGRYVRWVYDRFDLVLAPSYAMCDYLRSLGVTRTAHQPLGVDVETFSPMRRRDDLRARLGLPGDTRLLAFAGRFSGEKNLDVLKDAFGRLGEGYHLLLIGGGRHRRLAPNITLLPYRRDSLELAEWLASVDALVHAGTAETFGLVIVEALACGRPVVAVRAGAVPELVDEQVGMLAPRAEGALLERAVRELYERDLEALGRAARERAQRRFTWAHALQVQLNTYAGVMGSSRAPARAATAIGLGSP